MTTTARDYAFKYDKRKQNPFERLKPDEPWFFLRAQDKLSIEALQAYADAVKSRSDYLRALGDDKSADDLLKQSLGVMAVIRSFQDWQTENADSVKFPD